MTMIFPCMNGISMHENKHFTPEINMDGNSMHEIVHSPWVNKFSCMEISFSCMKVSYHDCLHAWNFVYRDPNKKTNSYQNSVVHFHPFLITCRCSKNIQTKVDFNWNTTGFDCKAAATTKQCCKDSI